MPYSTVVGYPSHPVFAANTGNPITAASNQRVDGGVIRQAGTVRTSRFIGKLLTEGCIRIGNIVFQSPTNWHNQVFKALSSGTFNSQRLRKFIIRRVTTEIATVASNAIRFGSDLGLTRKFNSITQYRNATLRSWSIAMGTNDAPASYSWTYGNRNLYDMGADHAATFTYAVPGELVYKGPKPDPVMADYKARTN